MSLKVDKKENLELAVLGILSLLFLLLSLYLSQDSQLYRFHNFFVLGSIFSFSFFITQGNKSLLKNRQDNNK